MASFSHFRLEKGKEDVLLLAFVFKSAALSSWVVINHVTAIIKPIATTNRPVIVGRCLKFLCVPSIEGLMIPIPER